VEKMIVAGDYVTVHMKFTGHFTGRFGQTLGKSQPIAFIAIDLVKVENDASPTIGISRIISRCYSRWVSPKSINRYG